MMPVVHAFVQKQNAQQLADGDKPISPGKSALLDRKETEAARRRGMKFLAFIRFPL